MNRNSVVKKTLNPLNRVKLDYNCHPCKMAWCPLNTGQLCRKYKATENFEKLSGERNIQGDCLYTGRYKYIPVVLFSL